MKLNLSEMLKGNAGKFPGNQAYFYQNESVTYQELDDLVDRFAGNLAAKGIGKGDCVALSLGNHPHFVIAYYGVLRTGAIVVPVNPSFTSRELLYILSSSRAKAIIANSSQQSMLNAMKEELTALQFVVYSHALEAEINIDMFLQESSRSDSFPSIDEEDVAVILYTSGTSGNPKGAMLTHSNLVSNAQATATVEEQTSDDRTLAVLPFFHVFCMTVCMNTPIACGASILIVPKFSPADVVQVIRDEKATIFAGVPTMYNYLLQLENTSAADFSSLRLCISGGAPMPLALLSRFEERFKTVIMEGYGLSEASPVTHFNPLRGVRKTGSVGLEIPGVSSKVVDENDVEVAVGEIGEIIIHGPNVMKGYLDLPEETDRALRNGWLYTGDMATKDEDGYVYIVDRKKDLILVGGYNVYPREVEEVLYQHPLIKEAAVVGVPDEWQGEAVKAFIVKLEQGLSEDEVRQYCADKLVKYKTPKHIEFIEELPKNTSGKILRRALRQ